MKPVDPQPSVFGKSALGYLARFVVILVLSHVVSTQSRNTITGFVFSPNRSPVPQIPVEVLNEVDQIVQRSRTDGSGRFFFTGLSSGRFTVRVLPLGTDFEEQSQEIEIVNFGRPTGSTSGTAQKDFYLRKRRNGPETSTVPGTVFAQEVPDKARKLYEKAISELDRDRGETGVQMLFEAVQVFPNFYLALERLGREYLKRHNYEYAHAAFLKTVSVNVRSFQGWFGLGYSFYRLKQPELAIEAAQRAITLEQSSFEIFLLLGILQRQIKQFADAEKSLLRAKKLANGVSTDVHWNLALLYGNNLKRFGEAADELEFYLKLAPSGAKTPEIRKLIADFRKKASSGGGQ